MQSTIVTRGQTAIPAQIMRRYGIKTRMRLEWIDDGTTITVKPCEPEPLKALRGRFRGSKLMRALRVSRAGERARG